MAQFPNPDALAVRRSLESGARQYVATVTRGAVAAPDIMRGGVARAVATVVATALPCRVHHTGLARAASFAAANLPMDAEVIAFAAGANVALGDLLTLTPADGADAEIPEAARRYTVLALEPFQQNRPTRKVLAEPVRPGQPAAPPASPAGP